MDLNLIPKYKKYDRWGLSVMDKKRESEWTGELKEVVDGLCSILRRWRRIGHDIKKLIFKLFKDTFPFIQDDQCLEIFKWRLEQEI